MVFSTKNLIISIVEIPFLFFHLSVLTVIIAQLRRKNPDFSGGFYMLFVIVSINDILLYLYDTIFLKFPDFGWFADFYLNPSYNHFLARWGFAGVAFHFYFNVIGYTIISFNRFTAFFFPFKHGYIWRPKTLLLLTIGNILISLILISYRLPIDAVYSWSDDNHNELFPSYVDKKILLPRFIVGASTNIFTCCIKTILDSSSVIKYRQLIKNVTGSQKRNKFKDLRLLMHSMLILCCHMYYSVYYVMEFIARTSGNNSLTAFWLNTMTDVDDIMVLASSVCLFILSLRKAYFNFYGLHRMEKLARKIQINIFSQTVVTPVIKSRNLSNIAIKFVQTE